MVTSLLFINTFPGEFVWDDYPVIVDNPEIKYWHFWDLWGIRSLSTRILSLMLDYHFFGMSPYGYHFQNILWHLLSVLLLYIVYIKLTGNKLLSFIGSLIYTVHPIHVEAVANISHRKDPLCMTFSLLTFLLYIKYIESQNRNQWLWIPIVLCWFIAFHSKGVALAIPIYLAAYEYVFVPKENRFLIRKPRLFIFGSSFIGLLIYHYLTYNIVFFKNGYIGNASIFSLIVNTPQAILTYMKLFIFPLNLSPQHVVTAYDTMIDPVAIMSWIAMLVLLILPFYLCRRMPLVSFGLFWFFINYIPVSSIVPLTYVVADRYMYIPSAGFCLIFVHVGQKFYEKLSSHYDQDFALKVTSTIFIIILILYSSKTITYNSIWINEKKLWDHAVNVSKNSNTAFFNRGLMSYRDGNVEQAINDYSVAIMLNPFDVEALYNRGTIYYEIDKNEMAIEDFNSAIELNPLHSEIYINRGNVYFKIGMFKQAMKDYNKAIKVDPEDEKAYFNRALIHEKMGEYQLAIKNYLKAVKYSPEYAEAYYRLATIYSRMGYSEQAQLYYDKASETTLK
ncbi:MAG: tetratricopeptide repeat protein [bacterium]|nr:tetratricopeptide repeat protein [bacterium]